MGRLGSMGQALADRLSRRNQRATVFEELLPDDAEGPPAPASNGMPPAESAPPPVQAVPAAGVPASGGFAELMQQLVREATRNRLKAPDQVAMANVWSFVSNRDGDPLVVDHLVRELAVKLHSNKPHKQWLAVNLVDSLYTCSADVFGSRKEVVARDVAFVAQRNHASISVPSFKARCDAIKTLQKMGMQQLMPQQRVVLVPHHAAAAGLGHPQPHAALYDAPQVYHGAPDIYGGMGGVPVPANGIVAGGIAGGAPAATFPRQGSLSRVETAAELKRAVRTKSSIANQHAEVLQELLCNFSTPDGSLDQEMLQELSEQCKGLLANLRGMLAKCGEHVDEAGMDAVIGEGVQSVEKVEAALELYEDINSSVASTGQDAAATTAVTATAATGGGETQRAGTPPDAANTFDLIEAATAQMERHAAVAASANPPRPSPPPAAAPVRGEARGKHPAASPQAAPEGVRADMPLIDMDAPSVPSLGPSAGAPSSSAGPSVQMPALSQEMMQDLSGVFGSPPPPGVEPPAVKDPFARDNNPFDSPE